MMQRCHAETGNVFPPGIIPASIDRLRSLAASFSPTFSFKSDAACSSGTTDEKGLGSSITSTTSTSRLREASQFQSHTTADSQVWLLSGTSGPLFEFGANDIETRPSSENQDNFTFRRFASRHLWRGAITFLFRFLPTTSNRSSAQASTCEHFSLTLRQPGQLPTNPDANVCHQVDALNHTAQRSAEAQLRVVRTQQLSVSGNELGVERMGPSGCQERTHQNEENNVSQCIADRRMSDRDHRKRAA